LLCMSSRLPLLRWRNEGQTTRNTVLISTEWNTDVFFQRSRIQLCYSIPLSTDLHGCWRGKWWIPISS
jgi:hypothetical protein